MKKAMLLISAVALIGACTAVSAQASPVVANEGGEAPGEVEGISTDSQITTSAGQIACQTLRWRTVPTLNSTTTYHSLSTAVVAQGSKATPHTGECELVGPGLKVKVTDGFFTVHIKLGGTGYTDEWIEYDITHPILGSIKCKLEGEASLSYAEGTDTYSSSGSMSGSGGAPCPTSASTSGTFTVVDENEEPLTIG